MSYYYHYCAAYEIYLALLYQFAQIMRAVDMVLLFRSIYFFLL